MSHILEMLGRGLEHDVGDVLDRYFWSPTTKSIDELAADCRHEPQRADLHLKLALAYLRSARLDEAIEHLRQATTIDPDDIGGRLALASAYEEAGDPARALEALRAANQIRPGEAPILFAIGFCLEKLRRPAEAAEYYRDAIDRGDGMLPARQRLAAVDMVLGDLDEAIVQHEAMLRERPDESWIYGTLGYLYHRKGRCAEAVSAFETAIAIEPENWSLIDDEVEALVANGQTRNAIDRLHQLIENQGPFADLRVRLADLYSHLGDDRGAMQFYLDAIDVEPHYLEAFVKLGSHHLAFGRWEEAAEAFGAAVELNDSLLLNYVGLGVAHAAAGSAAEAANSFELAEAVEPNSTILLTEMARLQMKAAAADEFARAFDSETAPQSPDIELDNDHLISKQLDRHAEQVREHPDHADARFRYGVLLRAEGRGADAMEQFAKAVEINPTYAQAIVRLGIIQQELGLGDEAVETFSRALEVRPKYVDVHYRLGLLYTDRRQLEEALHHMEAAAEGAPDNDQIRASFALALQNMGLMDRAAATWRSLWKLDGAKK